MQPSVDIAFDCLPLRSIGRVDIPLDASPAFRARCESLQKALDTHGTQNAYYLYNTRCVFRLANSEVENILRFTFEGTLLTDSSDAQADRADLNVDSTSNTCESMPPDVLAWFRTTVARAVLIEFNRFIGEGQLAHRVSELGQVESVESISGFAGMNL